MKQSACSARVLVITPWAWPGYLACYGLCAPEARFYRVTCGWLRTSARKAWAICAASGRFWIVFSPLPLPAEGKVTAPLACIILEGMSLGQVYHRGLGVRRYRITVNTPGGHSWIDFGQPSAVHELAALSTRITALDLPPAPRTTLNIGIISGGSSVNTIAATAMLELDLRSVSAEVLQALAGQVEGLVRQACKPGVEVVIETIGQRPAGELAADHPLVCLARQCLLAVGIEPHLNIGSTDANLPLSRGIPAVTIGLTTGGRAHTLQEYINLPPLEKGIEQLLRLVCAAWEKLPGS